VKINNQWKAVTHSFDGVEMVLVPPGCFMMGSDSGESDEKPMNELCFAVPFWIDRYEVTNAQFAAFVGQAGRKSSFEGANQPRERIYWIEARNFCAKRGARLPTEAEWEYAARGPDGLNYPWGNRFDANNADYRGNSNNQTADVGSKPGGASWVGALDMSGNVWEWVSTLYQPYPYSPTDGRENRDDIQSKRVIRGGGWGDGEQSLSATNRSSLTLSDADYNVGFRCARSF
jgi:formylglycine-generating enzyme required for sulfatase activity